MDSAQQILLGKKWMNEWLYKSINPDFSTIKVIFYYIFTVCQHVCWIKANYMINSHMILKDKDLSSKEAKLGMIMKF